MVQPFERADWPEALAELPADVQARWQAGAAAMRDAAALTEPSFEAWSLFLTGRAHARNVPIGAGTDTPIGLGIPGYSLHTELELLVRSGLTPREALAAATTVPARFFGLDDEMGSIVAGQAADLVFFQEQRGLPQARVLVDGGHVADHHVADPDVVRAQPAVRVAQFRVTGREYIGQGYQPDQLVVGHDRQVVDAVVVHEATDRSERVGRRHGLEVGAHDQVETHHCCFSSRYCY